MSAEPDDVIDEFPMTNRELDEALQPFSTRTRRREIIRILDKAGLIVFRDDPLEVADYAC